MSYKIQNRTPDSKRVKVIKRSDGKVLFPGTVVPTFQENTIQAGFCLIAIEPVPELTQPSTTFELTASPIGVDGRVSLYRNETLVSSMRYNNLSSNVDKVKWFNDFFGAVVLMAIIDVVAVFTIREAETVVKLVFEDDDIDYIFGDFQPRKDNRPAFFREQYRLAFIIMNNKIEIICDGANHTIYLAIQTTYSEESPTIFTIVDVGVPDEPKTIISLSGNTLPQNDDLVAPIIFASNSTYGDTFELRDYKVPYDEETINGQVKHIFLALTNRSDLDIRLQISVSDTSGQDLASVALGEGEDATNAVSVESPYEILACLNPYVEPLKEYLIGREEHQSSIVLIIRDWKTVGAWEFKIDGRDYLFKVGETIYDALVSLYGYNIAYPHRTDQLNGPEDRETFILYNNNAYAHTLTFKYVGDSVDPFEGILTIGSQASGTVVRTYDESKTMEIDLAGSKFGYVNQAKKFRIDWNASYLISGIFYVLEINGIEYRYTGTLEEIAQVNKYGLEVLPVLHPELAELVDIRDNGNYVSISNKTFEPLSVKLRLDRNMPYLNGVEEVWSKDNPKGLYLPTVAEVPQYDEDIPFYPYGIIQERNSVPITVSNEGYAFELAPSLAEPLKTYINYNARLNSRTRDDLTITGTVNYPDAEISFTWDDVKYTAIIDPVKVEGVYAWEFTALPYEIFENHVDNTPNGYIGLEILTTRKLEVVDNLHGVYYYKPTVFITPVTSEGYIQRMVGRNIVIDWGDGTIETFSNPTNTGSARHTYAQSGNYTIKVDRFNDPGKLLWIAQNTIGDATWSSGHVQDTGIKEIVQWESTGYSQIGAGSYTLEKIPNHPPPNTSNLHGFLQGSFNFDQDLTTWPVISPTNLSMAFQGCSKLTQIPPLETSNCTDFSRAFEYCLLLEPDLSAWETSKVTNMAYMLSDVRNFNSDISGWDVSKVKSFSYLFNNHNLFNYDISGWDVSSGVYFNYTFSGTKLFNQPLNSWNISNAKALTGMFFATKAFDQPLDNWGVDSDQMNLDYMFSYSTAFNSNISTWNVRRAIGDMFEQARSFNQPIGNWPVYEKPFISGGSMFNMATVFDQDLSSWVVNNPESVVAGSLLYYNGKTAWYPQKL